MSYYDFDGNKIEMKKWSQIWNSQERFLAQDEVNEYFVSTVWLGMNHNVEGGEPLIFETMTFAQGEDKKFDEYQWHYSTKEEALAGHAHAIALIKGEK